MKNTFLKKHLPLTKDARGIITHSHFSLREPTELEMKALGDDVPLGTVVGYASTSGIDSYDHIVVNGAFTESIAKRGLTGPKGVKLLLGHDMNKLAGVIHKLEQRPEGLWIHAQLNLNVSYVKDAYEAAKMNGGLSFSVGFFLQDYSFKENDKKEEYVEITKGDLIEVSIVVLPANDNCVMTMIKSREAEDLADDPKPTETIAEFEKALIAMGLAKSRNDAKKITIAVKDCAAFAKGAAPVADQTTKPMAAETKKQLGNLSDTLSQLKKMIALEA